MRMSVLGLAGLIFCTGSAAALTPDEAAIQCREKLRSFKAEGLLPLTTESGFVPGCVKELLDKEKPPSPVAAPHSSEFDRLKATFHCDGMPRWPGNRENRMV